jgi:hypothetical protein
MSKQPTTMDDLMDEFEFTVDVDTQKPNPSIKIDMGTEEDKAKAAAEEAAKQAEDDAADAKAAEAAKAGEGKTQEELDADAAKQAEDDAVKQAELDKAAEQASQGNNSGYKSIALKYIETGVWSEDLSVEDAEGNPVYVKDLEDIDEDTFFQIDKAVKELTAEENKSKFVSLDGVDERRKNIIEIVKAGGDLATIFQSKEAVEDYINPFSTLDLESEKVQERVYLNALIKHNKLDADTAQTVVEKAKKDLTLDSKVKNYVDQYTESFDKYVEQQKDNILKQKQEELKAQKEFKKALTEQYKAYEIKDTLARKLAASAVTKKDGEFEIDTVYAEKMENPEEAAELILFLTDKQAYLDLKMKDTKLEENKKTRRLVKILPREKSTTKQVDANKQQEDNEFEFKVK